MAVMAAIRKVFKQSRQMQGTHDHHLISLLLIMMGSTCSAGMPTPAGLQLPD